MSEYESVVAFVNSKAKDDLAQRVALFEVLSNLHSVKMEILSEYSSYTAKASGNIVDPKIRELIEKAQSEGLTLKQYQEKQARELGEKRAREAHAALIPTVGK